MAFTEFCCRSGGSNLNGGSIAGGGEPGTAAAYTSTNGNWNGTSTFTPTDGSTPASSVTVGDFASVYVDGATVGVYIAKVTAVAGGVNGTITLSTTQKAGAAPSSSATTRTITVGGAWKGPNGTEAFPYGLATLGSLGVNGTPLRINFKNDVTYSITAGITHSNGTVQSWGYTSTFGDLGKATLDGGTSGAAYALFTVGANDIHFYDFIFQNNGATGSAGGLVRNSAGHTVRCVANNIRGAGFQAPFGGNHYFIECEAYSCNQNNSAGSGGFWNDAHATFIRCISHDNTGSVNSGFSIGGNGGTLIHCISDSNGAGGFRSSGSNSYTQIISCDSYNNGGQGFEMNSGPCYLENCNAVKNGGYGIYWFSVSGQTGIAVNCRFGAGTQANTSGTFNNAGAITQINCSSYANDVTPWVDPANGDFRINLAAAQGAGRGSYTQTAASYSGTVGYPDIGSAQHQDTGGSSGPVAQLKQFNRGTPY